MGRTPGGNGHPLGTLRGIKERPAWEEEPRVLVLQDAEGSRLAEFEIRDADLTPRVKALLEEILTEIERKRQGLGAPVHIEH